MGVNDTGCELDDKFDGWLSFKVHLHLRISAMNTLKNLDVIMF